MVHIVTHPKTCLKIEQVTAIPDEAIILLGRIEKHRLGAIVRDRDISGIKPFNQNFFQQGRNGLTSKNVIPVENCYKFALSYLDLAAGYSFGHINPPDSNTMCVSNNLKNIARSL